MKDLRTLKKMLYQLYCILNKKQKIQMVGVFVAIAIGSAFELLGVTAMMPFIQAIITPQDLLNKPYVHFFCNLFHINDSGSVIVMVGLAVVLIYLIKNVYLSFSSYLQAAYSNKTKRELSVLMLQSYMSRPYSFFVSNGSKVIMQGVHADTRAVSEAILNGFKLLTELLVVLAITVYLIKMDWVLALGVVSIGIICLFMVVMGMKKKISGMATVSREAGVREYNCLMQASGGIKDIMVYSRQSFFLQAYDDAIRDFCKAATEFGFISSLPERIIEAFCVSGIIATVLIRLKMGVDVNSFVPKMAVFAVGAFRLLPSISRLTGNINTMVYHRQYVDATYDNITAARAFRREQEELTGNFLNADNSISLEDKEHFQKEIAVNNITWKYPEGTENVLDGLNLTVKKGESVGIIGESGSGKSTLTDIILRLYHPQKGDILVDGVNIDAIPTVWSGIIGYVPQSVFLVDDTIRENVVFGAENSDDNMVWEALEKASLHEFVEGLPGKLDTIVGERGVKFSGGQRQRIAIARALYANPQIMILDEATSALDSETEEAVMEAIDNLAGKMTLIIIAHRVTTLKSCNKIYEIIDGKAVERDKEEVIHGKI